MRLLRSPVGAMLIFGAALVWGAAPTQAQTVIAQVTRPTPVGAFGGHVVWSSYDASTRRYTLTEKALDGSIRRLPVATRKVPFDVDLGPGPSGRASAVYSRCRVEPPNRLTARAGSWYAYGRGCDIYLFDFTSSTERKLAASRSDTSEVLPTIWRESLVFSRRYERRRGARGLYSNLRAYNFKTRRLRAVPQPPQGIYESFGEDGYERGAGPLKLDLRGTRLGLSWNLKVHRCNDDVRGSSRDVPTLTELWLVNVGKSRKRVASSCGGNDDLVPSSPTMTAGGLDYRRFDSAASSPVSEFIRARRAGTTSAPTEAFVLLDTVTDGASVYSSRLVSASDSSFSSVVSLEDGLTYAPTRPTFARNVRVR